MRWLEENNNKKDSYTLLLLYENSRAFLENSLSVFLKTKRILPPVYLSS